MSLCDYVIEKCKNTAINLESKVSRRDALIYIGIGIASLELIRHATKAFAAEASTIDTVSSYYLRAEPVYDNSLPDGIRKLPFSKDGLTRKGALKPDTLNEKDAINWSPKDNFREEIFNSNKREKLNDKLKEYGVELSKFYNLLNISSNNISIGLYNSGKIVLFDGDYKIGWIFPTKEGIANAIAKEVYNL